MTKRVTRTNSPREGTRYISTDGQAIGAFYNSWDKQIHLAEFIPFKKPPSEYLCGNAGNFSPTHESLNRKRCDKCYSLIRLDLKTTIRDIVEKIVARWRSSLK